MCCEHKLLVSGMGRPSVLSHWKEIFVLFFFWIDIIKNSFKHRLAMSMRVAIAYPCIILVCISMQYKLSIYSFGYINRSIESAVINPKEYWYNSHEFFILFTLIWIVEILLYSYVWYQQQYLIKFYCFYCLRNSYCLPIGTMWAWCLWKGGRKPKLQMHLWNWLLWEKLQQM